MSTNRRRLLTGLIAAPAILSAARADASGAFHHQSGLDYTGYLLPRTPLRVGRLFLTTVGIGDPASFAQWEAGHRRRTFAPVMLTFSHSSESAGNEVWALPTAYDLSSNGLSFSGTSAVLGALSLRLQFTAEARGILSRHDASDHVVATGALSAGGRRYGGLSFVYTVGD